MAGKAKGKHGFGKKLKDQQVTNKELYNVAGGVPTQASSSIVSAGSQGGGTYQKIRLSIDNLHFSKQLTATSGKDTSRNITPIFMERPYTGNYKQLQSDAIAQLDIEQHRFESFEIETEGVCPDNLRFGDSFYLVDTDVVFVDEDDRTEDEAENKILLVAKKIEYTINGTDGGRGGFVRKILGVKRFA